MKKLITLAMVVGTSLMVLAGCDTFEPKVSTTYLPPEVEKDFQTREMDKTNVGNAVLWDWGLEEPHNVEGRHPELEVKVKDLESVLKSLEDELTGKSSGQTIKEKDIIEGGEINNYYCFNGSIYMQIDNYMYRFSVSDDGEVKDYVKYTLLQ